MLEVQKKATQLMFRNESLSYGTRLQKSGLTILETIRLHRDIIQMLKIFKGFDDIKYTIFQSSIELRGHYFTLYKSQVNLDARKYFFSNRVE